MKIKISTLLLLIVCCTLYSCKKDRKNEKDLYGKWKLTESMVDPGDGSGKYVKVTGEAKHLVFEKDGTFSGNGFETLYKFEIVNSTTLRVLLGTYGGMQEPLIYTYALDGNKLTINPPCIEGCGFKFIRQ